MVSADGLPGNIVINGFGEITGRTASDECGDVSAEGLEPTGARGSGREQEPHAGGGSAIRRRSRSAANARHARCPWCEVREVAEDLLLGHPRRQGSRPTRPRPGAGLPLRFSALHEVPGACHRRRDVGTRAWSGGFGRGGATLSRCDPGKVSRGRPLPHLSVQTTHPRPAPRSVTFVAAGTEPPPLGSVGSRSAAAIAPPPHGTGRRRIGEAAPGAR